MAIFLTEQDIADLLSYEAAIPLIEEGFRMMGTGDAQSPVKIRIPTEKGFLQFGPGVVSAKQAIGFKVWANAGTPLRGVLNFLYDLETGALQAIMQAYLLTKIRTAAVTSAAVKALSPESASTVGLFGSGKQADAQLAAICMVRKVKRAVVYSRRRDPLVEFCRNASQRLGIEVQPAEEPAQAARDMDIIVTVTSASQPIVNKEWITKPGLIVAQGANHWHERELDAAIVRDAKLITVDSLVQAQADGGDLLYPISKGMLDWRQVREIGDVLAGNVAVPDFNAGTILFKSHGIGLEDVVVSKHVYEAALKAGRGTALPM